MCGVAPIAPTSLPVPSTSAAAPSTIAGGIAAMPPAEAEALIPLLQQLVTALTALAQALQGQAALTAPGTSPSTTAGGAMGAPTAAAAAGEAHAKHGKKPKRGGGKGSHAGGHASHKGMRVLKREGAPDLERANRNFSAVYSAFKNHGRAGLAFKNNQTHGYISAVERERFRRANPGLPVPESIVFREGSNTPIGVTYRTNDPQNFDLGMGDRHDHTNDNGSSQMQHIWFTPGDLDLAFSDIQHGMSGGMSAVMRKRGYPT